MLIFTTLYEITYNIRRHENAGWLTRRAKISANSLSELESSFLLLMEKDGYTHPELHGITKVEVQGNVWVNPNTEEQE